MKTPIHLWIIGILALIWNMGGVFDYVAVKFRMDSYISQMPEGGMAFLDNAPAWYSAAWAIGVWFSFIGAILLLLRSRLAASAFAMSFLGLVIASIYSFVIADSSPMRDAGTGAMIFTVAIYIVLIILFIYARAMTRRGVLR
ncbi:hypothetical protein AB3Y40_12895 [Yoonia sp. R2331]|uniref:hypothetical protein n=1 Tax=Yoonia sp. R2331 TaxID=3237238 RepID=UPI0034E3C849